MTPQQTKCVELVQSFVGCSLHKRAIELRQFIARGLDNPDTILSSKVSDCGLFALAVWHNLEVNHELVRTPYQTGKAISWLVDIARELGAVRSPHDGPPKAGDLLHYYLKGTNDDHVEFVLSEVNEQQHRWIAMHGGGGRLDCAIGAGTSDVLWSAGRPLQRYYALERLAAIGHTEEPHTQR